MYTPKNIEIIKTLLKHKEYPLLKKYISDHKIDLLEKNEKGRYLAYFLKDDQRKILEVKLPAKTKKEEECKAIFKHCQKAQYEAILEILKKKKDLSFLNDTLTEMDIDSNSLKKMNGFTLLHFIAKPPYITYDEDSTKEHLAYQKVIDYLKQKKVDFFQEDSEYHLSPVDFMIIEGDGLVLQKNVDLLKKYNITKTIPERTMEIYIDKIHHFDRIQFYNADYYNKMKGEIPVVFVPAKLMARDWIADLANATLGIKTLIKTYKGKIFQLQDYQENNMLNILLGNKTNAAKSLEYIIGNNLVSSKEWLHQNYKGKKPITAVPERFLENFTDDVLKELLTEDKNIFKTVKNIKVKSRLESLALKESIVQTNVVKKVLL